MDHPVFQDTLLYSSFECYLFTTERASFPVPSHWHYFAEIIRVREGKLKITRGEKEYLLSTGDALFINPLTSHSLDYGDPDLPSLYDVIRLDMELFASLPSYTPDLRGMVQEAERRGLPMFYTAAQLHEMQVDSLIDQCVAEFSDQSYGYDLRIRSVLFLIFTSVIRSWIAEGFVPQYYPSGIDPIYTLPSYIAHHIREPLKVEDLAGFCGLSYPWFARKFHEIYGISCKEYIEKVRIRRVEHYLQFTDCNLNYIRSNTGYSDCSHLVRDFRKLRGITPGQFRNAFRKNPQGKGDFAQNY